MRTVSMGHWNDVDNQRLFLDKLAKKLNLTDGKSWCQLTSSLLDQHGGAALKQKYNGSIGKLLAHLNPNYKSMCRNVVQDIARELKLSTLEDIVNVPLSYFKAHAPRLIQQHDNSIVKCTIPILIKHLPLH